MTEAKTEGILRLSGEIRYRDFVDLVIDPGDAQVTECRFDGCIIHMSRASFFSHCWFNECLFMGPVQ